MRSITIACAAAIVLGMTACNARSPVAYGDANAIIVLADDSLWAAVGDSMHSVMEPQVFTVRNERMFELTHVSPADPAWAKLREWKQVLVIGRADDPWVADVTNGAVVSDLPAIYEKADIWARGQRVTAVILPDEEVERAVIDLLPELHEFFASRFRQGVLERMFVSGANTARRDSLRAHAGFAILLPNVYTYSRLGEAHRFLNANRAAGDRVDRSIVVMRRNGATPLTADQLRAWRDSLGTHAYEWGQMVDRNQMRSRALESYADGSIEVQGVWLGTDPTFPMAGPFLSRAIVCPTQNRTYLIDAFLYAPARDKYEYILQLQTILDSFECGS